MKMVSTVITRCIHNVALTVTKVKSTSNYMFRRHLLVTNLGISISLSATGDILEQNYEKLKSSDRVYSPRRTFNMGVTGLTIGFVCHHWYNWLDKFIPGRTIGIVMKKVLIDQLICSPATISTFFITLAVIERNSADEFLDEVRSKSWRLYLAEWVIWPPAQVINFYYLPTRYRVLYDNTISLGYDFYTSYVKHEIPTERTKALPTTQVQHNNNNNIEVGRNEELLLVLDSQPELTTDLSTQPITL